MEWNSQYADAVEVFICISERGQLEVTSYYFSGDVSQEDYFPVGAVEQSEL